MKVAIIFNKTELESLAAIAESQELRKAFKNLGIKTKKTSYSPVEKLGLFFGKPVVRTRHGVEFKVTKTTLTITGDIDLVSTAQRLVDLAVNKKKLNKELEKFASRLNKQQVKHLEMLANTFANISDEAKFQRLMR